MHMCKVTAVEDFQGPDCTKIVTSVYALKEFSNTSYRKRSNLSSHPLNLSVVSSGSLKVCRVLSCLPLENEF